jgi:hypothetical protein
MQHPTIAFVSGPLGYIVDAFRLATLSFENPHSYTKFKILKDLGRRYSAPLFIETGTYRGVTARRASHIFSRVITIELDEALATEATKRLAKYSNVQVLQGDASARLEEAFSGSDLSPAVVFLDAHFSGGETARGSELDPAVVELAILARNKQRVAAVVIDDFRTFGTDPSVPTKGRLLSEAERLFPHPEWTITVALDQLSICRTKNAGTKL